MKTLTILPNWVSKIDGYRIDIFLANLDSQQLLSKQELFDLDHHLSLRLDKGSFSLRLLCSLFNTIQTRKDTQLNLCKELFLSLKNKFLMILSSILDVTEDIETGVIPINQISLLIYLSSRILFVNEDHSVTLLLSNFYSKLLAQPHAWDYYFLLRTDQALIHFDVPGTLSLNRPHQSLLFMVREKNRWPIRIQH